MSSETQTTLTSGVTSTIIAPGTANNWTAVQVQNSSQFLLNVVASGYSNTIQPFTAATIPLIGDSAPLFVTPNPGLIGTVSTSCTFIWLLAGELPPMADGPLTGAEIANIEIGTVDTLGSATGVIFGATHVLGPFTASRSYQTISVTVGPFSPGTQVTAQASDLTSGVAYPFQVQTTGSIATFYLPIQNSPGDSLEVTINITPSPQTVNWFASASTSAFNTQVETPLGNPIVATLAGGTHLIAKTTSTSIAVLPAPAGTLVYGLWTVNLQISGGTGVVGDLVGHVSGFLFASIAGSNPAAQTIFLGGQQVQDGLDFNVTGTGPTASVFLAYDNVNPRFIQ